VALQRLEYFEYRGLGSFWGYLRRVGINQILSQARRGLPGASSMEAGEIGKMLPRFRAGVPRLQVAAGAGDKPPGARPGGHELTSSA
jgi:hypothetical protein